MYRVVDFVGKYECQGVSMNVSSRVFCGLVWMLGLMCISTGLLGRDKAWGNPYIVGFWHVHIKLVESFWVGLVRCMNVCIFWYVEWSISFFVRSKIYFGVSGCHDCWVWLTQCCVGLVFGSYLAFKGLCWCGYAMGWVMRFWAGFGALLVWIC